MTAASPGRSNLSEPSTRAAASAEHWNLPGSTHADAIRTHHAEHERRVAGFLAATPNQGFGSGCFPDERACVEEEAAAMLSCGAIIIRHTTASSSLVAEQSGEVVAARSVRTCHHTVEPVRPGVR